MGEDTVANAVASTCEGIESIEILQSSKWEEVSSLSTKLIETYFKDEEFEN